VAEIGEAGKDARGDGEQMRRDRTHGAARFHGNHDQEHQEPDMFGNEKHAMLGDSQAVATIPVTDAARAKAFYEGKLGLELNGTRPGVATYKSGNAVLFVYETDKAGTNKATAATWPVADVDAVVAELKSRGVAFERYDNLPNTEMRGDVHVTGAMKAAWFKDPDGNILSIVSGD
jgi:catechol 2,3-dioxygenase-like lactoylglutathione lyase family enzyme